jgi:ABC-type branched-subunit amino acid transport system ATPase component
MLALAPALVRPPRLLIVDEPSLGLAPLVVDQVYAALDEIRERGSAVLLVEEKAADALATADTIAFLSAGRLSWVAPVAEVDQERLVQSYLGITAAPPAPDRSPGPARLLPS